MRKNGGVQLRFEPKGWLEEAGTQRVILFAMLIMKALSSASSSAAVRVVIRLKVLILKAVYGLLNSFNPNATVNLAIRLKDSILNALDYLLNSDDALGFFEAFHALLAFLVAFLTAFIGLHFQVLDISPLESHFATILILIMTTIVYSIAHVEIKLPQNAEYLPILKLICLVSGIVALELLVSIIICPFWLLMRLGSKPKPPIWASKPQNPLISNNGMCRAAEGFINLGKSSSNIGKVFEANPGLD
ncbi:hypothetical protein CMV_010071 [Castanea mollissima]|uniref:Uncharacterized protein n=1 Tax=Castanea mollissima TaxID=60419 RepID=A0A8J4RJN4_9ROSI|nr:hypothetical protein CMV_010071 [Castanea mollissima]